MTITHSSTRLAILTLGAAAVVALAFAAFQVAPAHAASICPGYNWTVNLKQGSRGPSVMALQQFLNMSPDTQVASTGVGSPGSETSYFGVLTKAAVNKFQQKYVSQILTPLGLSTPTGNFFASSRAEANALCAGSTTTPPTTTPPSSTASGTAVVSAAAQPANGVAPASAARVAFTNFTVTANGAPVTINSVSVVRQGPSLDTDFSGVVLLNAATGVQIGVSRVFDSNHSATVGSSVTIPAGTSMTFTVAGNVAAAPASGDIASIAVTAINTSSVVSGSLPIVGASETFNPNLTIGSVSVSTSSFDPNSATSQPIGTTGYRFSGLRLTANSTEDLTFKSITWYESGSANALANVVTVVNGTSYPTTIDSTGRYYTTVFPTGIVIPKGTSVDVYVQGDLGSNTIANTVAEFDIYRNTDVYLVGNTYGYGITAPVGAATISSASTHATTINTDSNPWFQGSTVSVTAGSISTIQNATSVPAQNVATNVLNQPLGGFQTNILGEGITAQKIIAHFTYGSSFAADALLTNVSLVNQNGVVVAGPYNGVSTSAQAQTVTFTGSINFPTGPQTYTLEGEIPTTASSSDTIVASMTPSTDWSSVTGNTTGSSITLPSSPVTMNTMTIKTASLNVANGSTPASQNVVAGGQGVTFATVQLDASQSGEDLRLSSVPVILTVATGAVTDLNDCQFFNGTTALNTGSRVVNGSGWAASGSKTTFSLDNALQVPKGTVVQLTLQCSLISGATAGATYSVAVDPTTGDWSVTGNTSGNSVVPTFGAGSAPTMTASSGGTLTVSDDASSPAYALVAGGTTGATVNVLKFHATNEAVNLQKVGLTLTNTASSSAADLTQTYLYAGNNLFTTAGVAISPGTLLGTAAFVGNASTATSSLTSAVQIPNNQDATILVKADVANIGISQPATEGHLVAIDYTNSQGVGANSGKNIVASGLTGSSSAGIRIFKTIPTFATDSTLPSTGIGDGRLMEFSVTAGSSGPVGINSFNFTLATTTLSVTNLQLFVYTNSSYSNLAPGTFGASTGQLGSTVATVASPTTVINIAASTNPLEVPAGQTYYFKLIGSISGNATGASAVTTLIKDTVYPALGAGQFMGQTSTTSLMVGGTATSDNFVWTPNATTTIGLGGNDWTNGYQVAGFPSTPISRSY